MKLRKAKFVFLFIFEAWQPWVHPLPVECAITATGKGAFIDFFEQLFSSVFFVADVYLDKSLKYFYFTLFTTLGTPRGMGSTEEEK